MYCYDLLHTEHNLNKYKIIIPCKVNQLIHTVHKRKFCLNELKAGNFTIMKIFLSHV